MDHYEGITPDQRYNNDVLNELRQIRQFLERNAQALETVQIDQPQIRTRQKRSV